eukprot:Awhi_evm1s8103
MLKDNQQQKKKGSGMSFSSFFSRGRLDSVTSKSRVWKSHTTEAFDCNQNNNNGLQSSKTTGSCDTESLDSNFIKKRRRKYSHQKKVETPQIDNLKNSDISDDDDFFEAEGVVMTTGPIYSQQQTPQINIHHNNHNGQHSNNNQNNDNTVKRNSLTTKSNSNMLHSFQIPPSDAGFMNQAPSLLSLSIKSNINKPRKTMQEGFVYSNNNYFIVYHCEELGHKDARGKAARPFGSIETFVLCVTSLGFFILARDGHQVLLSIDFQDVEKITITNKIAEKYGNKIEGKDLLATTTDLRYHEYHCQCYDGVFVFDMLHNNSLSDLLRKKNITVVNSNLTN